VLNIWRRWLEVGVSGGGALRANIGDDNLLGRIGVGRLMEPTLHDLTPSNCTNPTGFGCVFKRDGGDPPVLMMGGGVCGLDFR